MSRKSFFILGAVALLYNCKSAPKEVPNCPFVFLQLQKEVYYSEDDSKAFLTEFESSLDALHGKIARGKLKARSGTSLHHVLTKYESNVFGGDSLFISYYNGLANNICMYWSLYQDRPDERNRDNLEQSIQSLQAFVRQYYQQGRPSQGAVEGMQLLLRSIRILKSELESYIAQIDYTRAEEIRLENYSRKLSYLELKLEQLDPVNLDQNDLHLITEVRMKFDPLAKDIEAEIN